MKLFSLSDLTKGKPKTESLEAYGSLKSRGKSKGFEIDLSKELPVIEMGSVIEFVSDGRWSIHQIVKHLITITGAVNVHLATWTITEEPLRMLFKLKNEGKIKELNCLFDHRIKERTPKSFQFASQFVDRIGLAKSHAKVTVLENEDWAISINSSMNWSKNPRTESGVIICTKQSADFHKNWINNKINANQQKNQRG
jgi:hypothetical protein